MTPPAARLPANETETVCIGSASRPTALLPGSFNPVHDGHWGLAQVASGILQMPVAFELSLQNVDKPDLTPAEAWRRAQQFTGRADLWLTRAPTFVQKAQLFPGAVFVIGADTAARIVAARYYTDVTGFRTASKVFDGLQCRFLVAARVDATGRLLTVADIAVPEGWRTLFQAIDPGEFRLDVSSTQLRQSGR